LLLTWQTTVNRNLMKDLVFWFNEESPNKKERIQVPLANNRTSITRIF